jgi:hypothetical protein
MPMWRCPHCATPQPEASRCWVCQRSSTCCATCRHYRRSIAAQLGYCGLDRRREPLDGTAIRACWAPSVAPGEPGPSGSPVGPMPADGRTPVRTGRDFVPVGEAPGDRAAAPVDPPRAGATPVLAGAPDARGPGDGWTLFPELEG